MPPFEYFTVPIRDNDGQLRVPGDVINDIEDLRRDVIKRRGRITVASTSFLDGKVIDLTAELPDKDGEFESDSL